MQTAMDTNGRRTAATWVAATGAFLLVAAAGVFVSVRWDDIPDAAKLGILLAGTGAALFGGQSLRRTLPATGEVLYHLGAFLLPIDLAAISVRTDMTWGEHLLAQGVLLGIGVGALALWSGSVVLRWAATAGIVVLAAGVAAVSAVPAPLALVAFAAVAAAFDDRAQVWWAAIAGLSPAIGGVAQVLLDQSNKIIGGGTLHDLGFDPGVRVRTAWLVGGVASTVLARVAKRRGDVALGFLAITTALLGVVTVVASQDTGPSHLDLTIAGAFLVLELVALGARHDDFWAGPLHVVATLAEIISVPVIALVTLAGVWGGELNGEPFTSLAVSLGVAALAWFAADLRRQPVGGLSVSLTVLRGGGFALANVVMACTAVGAVAVASVAVGPIPEVLAAAAVAALLVAGGRPGSQLVVASAVGLSVVVDPTITWLVVPAVAVCTWAAGLRRDPVLAGVAAVGFDVFVVRALLDADVSLPFVGLSLCITAIVWSGLAYVVDDDWRDPFLIAAGAAVVIGLPLAADDPIAIADAFIVCGGLVVAAGIVSGRESVAHAGGAAVTAGIIGHLSTVGVVATEAYVAPVALHLLVAGALRRRRASTSSWLAYVPSIALLGGAALAERLTGGAEWHALVAAGVGTAAVAIGGWQRLVGPLLVGTGLLVAVTANESLGALAGIPTWSWLAVAGTTLLVTGVALERTDTSPVEAGRRLVDVIGERFE
jgi:hypothetical protein